MSQEPGMRSSEACGGSWNKGNQMGWREKGICKGCFLKRHSKGSLKVHNVQEVRDRLQRGPDMWNTFGGQQGILILRGSGLQSSHERDILYILRTVRGCMPNCGPY